MLLEIEMTPENKELIEDLFLESDLIPPAKKDD